MKVDIETVKVLNQASKDVGSSDRKTLEELNHMAAYVKTPEKHTGSELFANSVRSFKHACRTNSMHFYKVVETLALESKQEHIQLAAASVLLDRAFGKSNLTSVELYGHLSAMSLSDALDYILTQTATGVIPVEIGKQLSDMLMQRHEARILPEIMERLQSLEDNLAKKTIETQANRHKRQPGIIEVEDEPVNAAAVVPSVATEEPIPPVAHEPIILAEADLTIPDAIPADIPSVAMPVVNPLILDPTTQPDTATQAAHVSGIIEVD